VHYVVQKFNIVALKALCYMWLIYFSIFGKLLFHGLRLTASWVYINCRVCYWVTNRVFPVEGRQFQFFKLHTKVTHSLLQYELTKVIFFIGTSMFFLCMSSEQLPQFSSKFSIIGVSIYVMFFYLNIVNFGAKKKKKSFICCLWYGLMVGLSFQIELLVWLYLWYK